ncbi:MAG: hypothetical protein V4484_10680 [Pseudomonadota bacterium]
MVVKHVLCSLAGAAMVAGCATPPPPPAPPKPVLTLASLMSAAEAAVKAGRSEEGVVLMTAAIAAFPDDKMARRRIAQVQFDSHDYGSAIFHAQQVVERDPNDLLAHSILAVSGLRVASKALADLAHKNDLTGSVRAEAQDLAKLLRANIGGEIIPALKPPKPEEHP